MTDDIVDWLRDLGDRAAFEPSAHHKAADEIETLRAALRLTQSLGQPLLNEIERLRAVLQDFFTSGDFDIVTTGDEEATQAWIKRARAVLEGEKAND